ncbi:hypothetical protein [Neobacillus jeddahensis]|uniref:hypothetical protein n=1 Tax=Neobacillus jeddahensis TaxID=1461580 RepID=UPI00058DD8EC|nr:hypothetical protein [Neobacillus jeddahensis]
MDKPNKGNTIKIKLNGEENIFPEELAKTKPEDNRDPKTRVIKIDHSKLDSAGFEEAAAAKDPVGDESFDWMIPESSDDDIEEIIKASYTKPKKSALPKITSFSTNTKKKTGRPLGSILIAAAFAILIGTTIGVTLLKLLISGPSDKEVTQPTVVEEQGESDGKAVSGNKATASLAQLTVYVIQGGVFSSEEGANETSTQITSKGVPAQLIKMDEKQYNLFLGVADSIETAKSLGNHYKEQGVTELFPKPLLLDEKKVSGLTDKEKSFIEAAPSIYQTLSQVTSSALTTNTISKESTNTIADFDEKLKADGIKNEKVKDIKAELTSADEKVAEYQKSKDAKSLTEAQKHLLNFLSIYFSL